MPTMASLKKSPPALIEAFDQAIAGEPRAERRQMFGYPCAFVNGHMAVGLHEQRLIARVPDEADRLPCVILGRRMKAYAAVELDQVMKLGVMLQWVRRAVEFTATMAPKPAKPRKAAAPRVAGKAASMIEAAPSVKAASAKTAQPRPTKPAKAAPARPKRKPL
jgi:hypothetical protein